MPYREWKLRIEDILESVSKINHYIGGMNFEKFCPDEKTVDATVRNLTVIGEAARHIPNEVQQRYPRVPWAEMRGMRNIVVHEYFGISLAILWHTITQDLPPVVPMLNKILERES